MQRTPRELAEDGSEIDAAPNVISNEMLMTNVWPGLIVSPETVNKRAKLLRDVLGDDAREPRYIAGVRSRGYRLVASISLAADIPPAQDLPPPAPQTGDHRVEPPNADTHNVLFLVSSYPSETIWRESCLIKDHRSRHFRSKLRQRKFAAPKTDGTHATPSGCPSCIPLTVIDEIALSLSRVVARLSSFSKANGRRSWNTVW
jgi:hypothetical protein